MLLDSRLLLVTDDGFSTGQPQGNTWSIPAGEHCFVHGIADWNPVHAVNGSDLCTGEGDMSIDPSHQSSEMCEPPYPCGEDCVCQPCTVCMSEEPPEEKIRIRASIFFDGTGNNRTNTRAGSSFEPEGDGLAGTASYANDVSNVARLEWLLDRHSGVDISIKMYVEGMGTSNLESDSIEGMVFGEGVTGVVARVRLAMRRLLGRIRHLSCRKIEILQLDAFGFSRGAAAARHFVWRCIHRGQIGLASKLRREGFEVEKIEFVFVGLFDTVASWGMDHDNDTSQLNLDAIVNARHVVQLAAAEEHRKNFPSTSIASKGSREIFCPGVHSDVGGGYNDRMSEDLVVYSLPPSQFTIPGVLSSGEEARFRSAKEWLTSRGWYRDSEIQQSSWTRQLTVTRSGIRNKYTHIPLQIMAEYGRVDGQLNFCPLLETRYTFPPGIAWVKEEIIRAQPSSPAYWMDRTDQRMKDLRHAFFHFSAHYGTVAGLIHPMIPNFVDNHRQREIIAG